MKEVKKTTLEKLSYNGTQVVRQGESTIPAFVKTCFKCGTKFFYISEAIKHDRDGDYVVCPSCGAFIAHHERPKTADFIPPKCTSDAKCEDRSPKHSDSFTNLETAARLYAIPHYMKDVDENYLHEYPYDPVAEAAFIAGAQWQAEHTEDYPMPEDTVLFQKGVAEGKRLMLEDAIGGHVTKIGGSCFVKEERYSTLMAYLDKFNDGDKVKIIIVMEE